MFDICVWGYMFPNIETENVNKAKMIAIDKYYDITGLQTDINDPHIVWKNSDEYPYEWK